MLSKCTSHSLLNAWNNWGQTLCKQSCKIDMLQHIAKCEQSFCSSKQLVRKRMHTLIARTCRYAIFTWAVCHKTLLNCGRLSIHQESAFAGTSSPTSACTQIVSASWSLGFPDCQGPLDPPQPPYLGQTVRNSYLMCANSNFPILRQCAMLNLYFAAKIHISHFVKNKTLEHDMY